MVRVHPRPARTEPYLNDTVMLTISSAFVVGGGLRWVNRGGAVLLQGTGLDCKASSVSGDSGGRHRSKKEFEMPLKRITLIDFVVNCRNNLMYGDG